MKVRGLQVGASASNMDVMLKSPRHHSYKMSASSAPLGSSLLQPVPKSARSDVFSARLMRPTNHQRQQQRAKKSIQRERYPRVHTPYLR